MRGPLPPRPLEAPRRPIVFPSLIEIFRSGLSGLRWVAPLFAMCAVIFVAVPDEPPAAFARRMRGEEPAPASAGSKGAAR